MSNLTIVPDRVVPVSPEAEREIVFQFQSIDGSINRLSAYTDHIAMMKCIIDHCTTAMAMAALAYATGRGDAPDPAA